MTLVEPSLGSIAAPRDYKTAPKRFWHPMGSARQDPSQDTLIIRSGDGNYVTDVDGNRLLDGVAGLWNVNVGHNRPTVKAAIAEQLDELA